MSFKRPFGQLSVEELNQKLRRLAHYFEQGEELTDQRLDAYLLIKKKIEELSSDSTVHTALEFNVREDRIHCSYWVSKLLNHQEYSHLRFKILKKGYPNFDFYPGMLDPVSKQEFNRYEKYRLPLFIGTQLGLYPKTSSLFFYHDRIIAILGKSTLSGHVSGLSLYRIKAGDNRINMLNNKIITFKNEK